MTRADNSWALVLVDGRSGAGKSDYATALAKESGATLVSLDDVYPGWDGLDAGSWHIAHHLIVPIASGQPGRYRRWDWASRSYGQWIEVSPEAPLIIEGCGGVRREHLHIPARRVWIEAPEELRKERALARDGDMYRPQWGRWALQEERFIALHGGRALADEVVRTT
jgi:hypothetical protein